MSKLIASTSICFVLATMVLGCTTNVEDPTVDQTGRTGDVDATCVEDCDTTQTECVGSCDKDSCEAICSTDHDECVTDCDVEVEKDAADGVRRPAMASSSGAGPWAGSRPAADCRAGSARR